MERRTAIFLLTMPDEYQEDLTKYFDGEVPEAIHNAYKLVSILTMAQKWTVWKAQNKLRSTIGLQIFWKVFKVARTMETRSLQTS